MPSIFWFDTETTGLSSLANDIVQLAWILDKDGQIVDSGEFVLAPHVKGKIESRALEVIGKTQEQLNAYPPQATVFRQIVALLDSLVDKYDKTDKLIPAGFNVRFDIEMLSGLFRKNNHNYFGSYFWGCPLDVASLVAIEIAEKRIKLLSFKLGDLCAAFNITLDAHDAISDIAATRLLYYKLRTSI